MCSVAWAEYARLIAVVLHVVCVPQWGTAMVISRPYVVQMGYYTQVTVNSIGWPVLKYSILG